MSQSSLVEYVRLSPNRSSRGGMKIRKITIHHAAAKADVAAMGALFASPARRGSANYGIDSDGRVGLYVDEAYRAWTSGSPENDAQAVTIEVSNSSLGGDWPISDAAYDKLILLCADICLRNGITALQFTGDATGNLTMHRYFQLTSCPGTYLAARFPEIAAQVNRILKGEEEPMTQQQTQAFATLQKACSDMCKELQTQKKEISALREQVGVRWAYADGSLPKWAQKTVQKLCGLGLLQGDVTGSLALSYQFLRTLVILDRAGVFDGK